MVLLSYFNRNQAEMAHTCRGTISLHGAIIHTENYSCNFVVSNGGGTQTFHLRASSEVERQKWVTALELAKAKAIQMMESDEEDEGDAEFAVEISKQELVNAIRGMAAKLENLQTCNDLIVKHGHALQRSVSELESASGHTDNKKASPGIDASINSKMKNLNERATLFKITSNAMINACTEFMELTQSQGRKWQRLLAHEREQRLRLEEMVEQLARQHSQLEHQCKKTTNSNPMHPESAPPVPPARRNAGNHSTSPVAAAQDKTLTESEPKSASSMLSSDDEDDFHDAVTDPDYAQFSVSCPPTKHKRSGSSVSGCSTRSDGAASSCAGGDEDDFSSDGEQGPTLTIVKKRQKQPADVVDGSPTGSSNLTPVKQRSRTGGRQRRTRVPEKPDISLSLWSIMKNSIGKDLSKIPIPVNFSEPLSS